MRTLVTGGNGFIGSHLTERLLRDGHEVVVVDDLSTGRSQNLSGVRSHPKLEVIEADFGNPKIVARACEGVDRVYHLAAAVGVALIAKQPVQTIHRNIYPTQLLLDELQRQHNAGKTISMFMASTSEVYGKNPKSIWNEGDDLVFGTTTKPRWSYGASKAIDEFLSLACVREHGMPIVIGRFFNVAGPRQSGAYGMVLPRFIQAAMKGGPLVVHDDGQQVRCFAHVSDIIEAVIGLMNTPRCIGNIYNIGADQPVAILEMAKRVVAIVNPAAKIEFQSYSQAYDQDFEDIRRRVPDLTRIRNAIQYSPTKRLDDIIVDVWHWFQTQNDHLESVS
jgi:UDP-glucose 4-epimerase